jgi:hypothetical protein
MICSVVHRLEVELKFYSIRGWECRINNDWGQSGVVCHGVGVHRRQVS